ncbi:MAG: hypothetical protein AB9883_00950 [Acidaminococcaceae bacterium]
MEKVGGERENADQSLVDKLILLCEPECISNKTIKLEADYIKLTDLIAQNYTDWHSLGEYGRYIELSTKAIDYNLAHIEKLDLNSCVATLICIHREQHFVSADVIGARLQSGKLLKLAKRLKNLVNNFILI